MVKLARIAVEASSSSSSGGGRGGSSSATRRGCAGRGPLLAVRLDASSFRSPSVRTHLAAVDPSAAHHYVDVSSVAATASAFLSMGRRALEEVRALVGEVASPDADPSSAPFRERVVLAKDVTRVLSPLDGRTEVGKFLCVGMNYVDHCTEQDLPVPTVPLIFNKFGSSVVGPGDPIPRYGPPGSSAAGSAGASHGGTSADPDEEPVVTSKLDYEVELGIVIGSTVPRFTPPSRAAEYIGGFTVVHDVSARDLQLEANGGQWLLGKCGDGYAPIGPVITTLDDFVTEGGDDPLAGAGDLKVECRLWQGGDSGGEAPMVVQSSSTSNLVFSTPQIVSYISKFMTLHPGDVIATGTPPGVGCFRKPDPLWLEDGDIVECEIEGIGILRNEVLERPVDSVEAIGGAAETNGEVTTGLAANEPAEAESASPSPIVNGPPSQTDGTKRLKNTTCIVTGAARGIGYGIALRLALEGARVVALIDRKQGELDDAASRMEKELRQLLDGDDAPSTGPTFYGLACDVTDADQVADTFQRVASDLSPDHRIDVLVQAAGVVGQTNLRAHQVPLDNFDFVMDVNVRGIFNGCKSALPQMLKQGYGRIVNIASIAGKEGNAGMLAYSTSKAAVIGLTKTIGKEYAEDGITCNAIAPAVVRTEMVAGMPADQVKYMTDKIPM
ncbi:hypothetical protein ACHAWF_004431 [Thalassiosira exigua]